MRRIIVRRIDTGRTILDSVGEESIIDTVAAKFREAGGFIVSISYP